MNPFERIAYVQKNINGDWLNEDCYSVAKGLNRMMYRVIPFHDVEVLSIIEKTDYPNRLVYTSVKNMVRVFDILNIKQPEVHNPHTYLPNYMKRNMGKVKLKDIRNKEISFPIFIKPFSENKLFTGFVVESELDLLQISNVKDDADILYSEVIDIVSEYRCFIHKRKLIGCKNYTGDFKVLPNFDVVENAINDYEGQPIAYSLDFAITKGGDTVLIEINDGFSLGMYGFNYIAYCKMMIDRWNEIIKIK